MSPSTTYLSFSASKDNPIAWHKKSPVFLTDFRSDVTTARKLINSKKKHVILSTKDRYLFSVALLACWIEKKVAILPPSFRDPVIQDIHTRYDADLAFNTLSDAGYLSRSPENPSDSWTVEFPASQSAVILFTSGSTGESKAIEKTIGSLLLEARMLSEAWCWQPGGVLASVPPQHLYGLTFSVLLPWVLGKAILSEIPEYPDQLAKWAKKLGSGAFITIPLHLKSLIQTGDIGHFARFTCVSAAAPLTLTTASEWFHETGTEIQEIYGSTETGVIASRNQMHSPLWQAVKDVKIESVDSLLQLESPYLGKDLSTPYLTSDHVCFNADGKFTLLGRADNVVKIGGKRVSTSSIEQLLESHPKVKGASVVEFNAPGMLRDTALGAAVELHENAQLSSNELRVFCRGKTETTFIPRKFVFVQQMPRSSSGKPLKLDVKKLFGQSVTGNHV